MCKSKTPSTTCIKSELFDYTIICKINDAMSSHVKYLINSMLT